MIASDRCSILADNAIGRQGIELTDISPRAAVPPDIRLWFVQARNQFEIQVQAEIEGEWVTAGDLDQVNEWIKNGLIQSSGSLSNLKQSMRCSVVAIEGFRSLYQVKQQQNTDGSTALNLKFSRVDSQGEVDQNNETFDYHSFRRLRVLALNPNYRYLGLLRHIETEVNAKELNLPLKHFLGQGEPMPVVFDLHNTVPETLKDLNEDQRSAGHPLCLRSAGEVAGPPGTGTSIEWIEDRRISAIRSKSACLTCALSSCFR